MRQTGRRLVQRLALSLGVAALVAPTVAPAAGAQQGGDAYWFLDVDEHHYEYAVGPAVDAAAWRELATYQEMIDSLALDAQAMSDMSTGELLAAVLDYPLLGDFLAYPSPQEGFDALVADVPQVRELMARGDVGVVALDAYARADLETLRSAREFALIEIEFLETLLSQEAALEALAPGGRARLAQAILDQLAAKRSAPGGRAYGETAGTRALMRALTLDSEAFDEALDREPDTLGFVETGASAPQALSTIPLVTEAQRVYGVDASGATRAQVVGPLRRSTIRALPRAIIPGSVTTPRGTVVAVQVATSEPLTSAQIQSFNQWIAQGYPNATPLRPATGKYNCHSYAWHSTSASNNVWMNTASAYRSDGSYRRVVSTSYVSYVPSSAPVGARVNYVGGNHSGVRYSSTRVDSKWGQYGLMRHAPNYTPYPSTTALECWAPN